MNSSLVFFEGEVVFSSFWRRVGRPAENLTRSQASVQNFLHDCGFVIKL